GVVSSLGALLVERHHSSAADRDARREHVAEHRVRERPANPSRGMEARLPFRPREGDHDGDHAGNYARCTHARGDTPAVTIAATQAFRGAAWGELPDVTLLEAWPPTQPLPGVGVLVEAVVAVGPDELDLLPDLRLVANYGVGYDRVDIPACRDRGVVVTNTPGVLDAAVADLTLALILACC